MWRQQTLRLPTAANLNLDCRSTRITHYNSIIPEVKRSTASLRAKAARVVAFEGLKAVAARCCRSEQASCRPRSSFVDATWRPTDRLIAQKISHIPQYGTLLD